MFHLPPGAAASERLLAAREFSLIQVWRAYEPQTTFPAFTFVLTFIAFSSSPGIFLIVHIKAVVVPIHTTAGGAIEQYLQHS
jgi:hypothetical protein